MRFWAAPTKARPSPWRSRGSIRGTSDSAAGRDAAIPTPWSARTSTNGRAGAAGLDAGEQEDAARDEVGAAAQEEETQPAERVHEPAADDRRGHLDERRHADDQADLRVRHIGPRERERERRRVAVEAGLDQEQRDREADDVHEGLWCSARTAARAQGDAVDARASDHRTGRRASIRARIGV